MKGRLRAAYGTARELADAIGVHQIGVVAAALAFYITFALVPIGVAFGLIASVLLTPDQVVTVASNVGDGLHSATAAGTSDNVWAPLVKITAAAPSIGLFTVSGLLAIAVALFSSSRIVVTTRRTLDAIFDTPVERNGWLLQGVAAIIALIGFITLAAAAAVLLIVPRIVTEVTGVQVDVGREGANWLIGFLILGVAMKFLYQYGPHSPVSVWRRVGKRTPRPRVPWFSYGAWFAAAWVTLTSAFLGILISMSAGSAILIFGTPVIVMVWLYAVAAGALLGAEITALERRHRDPQPTP